MTQVAEYTHANDGPTESRPNVYAAIAWVQGKLAQTGISKGQENKQQHYKFRGIDDVYNALAPLLSEAGLCILPRVVNRDVTEQASKGGGKLFYVVLDMEFDFVSVDGSLHTVRMCGEAMDSGDKATNKAMSAAYKYACIQTFCIPTQGDNDADATTHEVAHYSKEQFERFHELVSNGEPLAYLAYMRTLSPNVQTALYNSWEHGGKVEGKRKCDKLESAGVDLLTQYVDTLREAVQNDDGAQITETVGELDDTTKQLVWTQLDTETQKAIRETLRHAQPSD